MAKKRARKTLIESTQSQSATRLALGGPLHSKTQGCASFTSENNTAKTSAKTPRVRKLRQELAPNAFAARNVRQGKTVQDGKTRNRKTLERKRRRLRKIGSGVIVAPACAHAGERRTPLELTYAPSMPRVASGFTSVLIRQGLRPTARHSAGGKSRPRGAAASAHGTPSIGETGHYPGRLAGSKNATKPKRTAKKEQT